MAIKSVADRGNDEIVGKYGFLPAVASGMEVGPPCLIMEVSRSRLYYTKVPRVWIREKKAHEFLPIADVLEEDLDKGYFKVNKAMIVCDTLDEAISVYQKARDVLEEVSKFAARKKSEFYAELYSN